MDVTFVGTWIPRRCGIATFTHDLVTAVRSASRDVRAEVVAIDEPGAARLYGPEVIGRIRQGDSASYRAAAHIANGSDVVNVQHEFGLYGVHRDDGWEDHLLAFLERTRVPVMTWLHTVLPRPEPWMRQAVRAMCRRSARVVVMARTAARLLREVYGVESEPLVIPHGVPVVTPTDRAAVKRALGLDGRTVISTFGLVDPRKGIEHVIHALPGIIAVDPSVVYVVIGQTHPELIRRDGEAYRQTLIELTERLDLQRYVTFIDSYQSLPQLIERLHATDIYLTPYLDPNQITSGTLAYALGAGKAIVSTRYQHAVEVLGEGRGILVDFAQPDQIATAVARLIRDPAERKRLEARAYEYGKLTTWPVVGRRTYEALSVIATPKITRRGDAPPSRPRREMLTTRSA